MLMKKGLILHFFIIVSLMILTWLVMLSFEIGNLAYLADDNMTYNLIFNICIFMVSFLASVLICNTEVIESDLKCGWRRFSMSIPVSPAENASVKTIVRLILTAAAFLLQILNYAVICAISDREFKSDYLMIFLIMITVCLLSDFITTAFMLTAKNEKAIALSKASPLILMIPCLFIANYFIGNIQEIMQTFQYEHPDMTADEIGMEMINIMFDYIESFFGDIFVFVIPFIVIIFAAGFMINTMILKRRDK